MDYNRTLIIFHSKYYFLSCYFYCKYYFLRYENISRVSTIAR